VFWAILESAGGIRRQPNIGEARVDQTIVSNAATANDGIGAYMGPRVSELTWPPDRQAFLTSRNPESVRVRSCRYPPPEEGGNAGAKQAPSSAAATVRLPSWRSVSVI